MLYLAHFSFSVDTKPRRKAPQPWHGYFTAVTDAADATAALKQFEALVRKTADTSELLEGVSEIYLESCVELRATPRGGFLAHVALLEGDSAGSISTTLPSVGRTHARSYHYEPEHVDADGGFEAEPFMVLETGTPARRASAPKPKPTRKRAARTKAR